MTTGLQQTPRRVHTGSGGPLIDLLAAIFRGGPPALPDAACVGADAAIVMDCDNASGDAIARAVAVCGRCEALEPCRRWADGQRHLVGVVGGRYRGSGAKLKQRPKRGRGDHDETTSETREDNE